MEMIIVKNKIVIIGCGNVGMSYAYALLNQKTPVSELVLIDINTEKAKGEAMDLNHGLPFGPSKINIYQGDYSDCSDAKIVCIAAGANQEAKETRMDLIYKNSVIFKSIIKNVIASSFQGIFLIATNPVDVMTYLTFKYSNFPTNKVIGTGTILDTARLRYLIGEKTKVNPKNIHAYVMGEHGDSEFVPWSLAKVGLEDINKYLTIEDQEDFYVKVRDAAYEIIERKGNTSYGIGMSLVRITNAILGDENTILAVSSYDETNKVFVGGPTIINKDGVRKRIFVDLTKDEEKKLQNSINVIKEAINKVDL